MEESSPKSTKDKSQLNRTSQLGQELAVISNSLATLHKSISDMQQQLAHVQSPPKNSLVVNKNQNGTSLWRWIATYAWPIFIVFVYHLFKKRFLKKNSTWL
jgi:hypothetical protein